MYIGITVVNIISIVSSLFTDNPLMEYNLLNISINNLVFCISFFLFFLSTVNLKSVSVTSKKSIQEILRNPLSRAGLILYLSTEETRIK